ncbi:elongator complex protein 2 [Kwoniella heveanensis BCC8398]|uniref:Elongator complex protein 2 n=1 Tax=Kwoniella heveanensis BCC8398 TaxID=1296120 RepID=A0A1B9H033_9TREE|nr:elongator complex protein 2 [Kwoniella heveanensis BCC8398]
MRVEPAYISIGTNRSSSCSAATSTGLLAFGAGKLLALWDPSSSDSPGGVQKTLPGHRGQITTVKALSKDRFISGDNAGEVRIWEEKENQGWTCERSWKAHMGSISALGVNTSEGRGEVLNDLVITGGSDGTFKFWRITGEEVKEIQRIDLKGKLPLDVEVGCLPGSKAPIVVVGCTDRRIRIYTYENFQFMHSLSLEGHEDWIRCLSFTSYPSSNNDISNGSKQDLLLASGSQDNFIRLWRVSLVEAQQSNSNEAVAVIEGAADPKGDAVSGGLDMLDEFEKRLAGEAGGNVQISTKAHVLAVQDGEQSLRYNITLEALLVGHESGLTNVHWSPSTSESPSTPILLSSASDNSLIIWTPSSTSTSTDGIWVPEHRFGAIGGRGLSFYGAIWGKDGKSVLASGWNGGWERWAQSEDGGGGWEVKAGLNGHHGEVQSVAWDPRGEYLLSVGSDQSSRIHAECSLSAPSSSRQWAEIARPQIHGYDMTDVAFITPLRFVSSADEKVVRVFDAPEGFVESLRTLGVSESSKAEEGARPKGATVPPLGLSNRALQKAPAANDDVEKHGQNEAHISISHTLTTLPTEEELATSTLWPEIEKVYGHGYELVSVAASHSGKLIATASKATNLEHAAVRVTSTDTWDLVGDVLAGHSLTVTRVGFSGDDERILTCSRDRGWRIFQRDQQGEGYVPLAGDEKAHSRMVLDACWADGKGNKGDMFATASRDKTVKIWVPAMADATQWIAPSTIKLDESATAVEIIGLPTSQGRYLVAVGTESGSISIHALSRTENGVTTRLLNTLDQSMSHVGAINRLAFRRLGDKVQMASASDDRSVRVFDIVLEEGEL